MFSNANYLISFGSILTNDSFTYLSPAHKKTRWTNYKFSETFFEVIKYVFSLKILYGMFL